MQSKDLTHIKTVSTLGQVIAKRRKALGMTQKELSSITGIAQSNVSKLESGASFGRLETYLKICTLVGVDLFAAPHS